MRVWQIGAGEPAQGYGELHIKHDIMIIGPGRCGDAYSIEYDGSQHKPLKIDHFAHKPKPGDRVLMLFNREVIGVGQIPDGEENQYSFSEMYKVYSGDLYHCRRVIWAENYDLSDLKDDFIHRGQIPAFTEVHVEDVVKKVSSIDSSFFSRPLKELPDKADYEQYTEEELGIELFRRGLSNKNIEDITAALQQAEKLYSWYQTEEHCGRKPTEQEIVSHMVLPVLLGLGWSHKQVAVEWEKVDMAFFTNTPTTKNNCVMVLEAKGLGRPMHLINVKRQAEGYIQNLKLKNVRYILTTDGANLFVYEKKNNHFPDNPVGYINISSRLQKQYLLPKDTNPVDTLVRLQPNAM